MTPSAGLPWPSDAHLRRWMMCVDGENFAIRGRKFAQKRGLQLTEGKFYLKDVFLWFPTVTHACKLKFDETYQGRGVRAYYYTSIVGDDRKIESVKESLWELGFEPKVFKRPQGQQRSKGVDISLTVDLLSHANRTGMIPRSY